MGIFDGLINGIGSLFGGTDTPGQPTFGLDGGSWPGITDIPGTPGADSGFNFGNVVDNASSSASHSFWESPSLWSGIITAGTGLAGTYYNGQNAAAMNAANLQQAQNQIAEQEKLKGEELANQLKVAGMYSGAQVASAKIAAGAALGVARKNNLQQLYSQWATNTEKAGQDEGDAAIKTGQLMQAPILSRLQALR